MAGPITFSCTRLLLVEGSDDQNFWQAVLAARGVADVQVQEVGGRDQIRARLKAIRNTPGFDDVRWLGILQDADDDANAACDRICGALEAAGLPVPEVCWRPLAGSLTVVACVLPGGGALGSLESLVKRSTENRPAAACVDAFLACCGLQVTGKYWKAWVHAYLSSLDPPDLRLGHAAQRRLLDLDSSAFDELINLIP